MKKVSSALLIFGLTLSASAQVLSFYTDSDAYEIYSSIIAKEWPIQKGKATNLVIQTETREFPGSVNDRKRCLIPSPQEEPIYRRVIEAYHRINKTPLLLDRRFDFSIPYELVPKSSIDAIFANKGVDGWTDFYAKYPNSGGIVHMSAVGFNADKTFAIVYVGHACGGRCGGGKYHILKKRGNKWSEAEWIGNRCSWRS